MKYKQLGRSGLRVSELSLGTGTFGGRGPLFSHWGTADLTQARRMVDQCIDAGVNLFDTADVYSSGASEEILGQALEGRRERVLISTKLSLPMGDGPNDWGASRARLVSGVDAALRRLGTDHIDIFQLHAHDVHTPPEELGHTLDTLVRSGKVRYVGVSNVSAWRTMRALALADRQGWPRYVCQQVYYSLIGRDFEHEILPLGQEEGLGALVWSPLGWGRLTGKLRRGQPLPDSSRLHETASFGPPVDEERLFAVLDVLFALAEETGRTVPQLALAWLLERPTVSSVIIGARTEAQLADNLAATTVELNREQHARLRKDAQLDAPAAKCVQDSIGELLRRGGKGLHR